MALNPMLKNSRKNYKKRSKWKGAFEIVEEGNHRYIFFCNRLIYKQWLKPETIGTTNEKTEPSMVIDKEGWPNFKI